MMESQIKQQQQHQQQQQQQHQHHHNQHLPITFEHCNPDYFSRKI